MLEAEAADGCDADALMWAAREIHARGLNSPATLRNLWTNDEDLQLMVLDWWPEKSTARQVAMMEALVAIQHSTAAKR